MFGKRKARTFPRWGWEKLLRVGYLHIANGEAGLTREFRTPTGYILIDFDEDDKVIGIEVFA